MLEEPITRSPSYYGLPLRSLFEDPFVHSPVIACPSVDLTEEDNSYVLQAELPGVKKENIELKIGDGGRSITIDGSIPSKLDSGSAPSEGTQSFVCANQNSSSWPGSTDVIQSTQKQLSVEGAFTGSSTFTRTVWLPRQVDAGSVSAKLSDGILTVRLTKAEDKASIKVPVE
jgi:HSP20 family protein